MIDGHGDDSYKYSRPITANFSSNVYNKVNLSRLKVHLCECIGEIGNYPEPEPIRWKPVWLPAVSCRPELFA